MSIYLLVIDWRGMLVPKGFNQCSNNQLVVFVKPFKAEYIVFFYT